MDERGSKVNDRNDSLKSLFWIQDRINRESSNRR